MVHDYRPISLIPCAYQIIARVLVKRLKRVLLLTITENQFAFEEGRQILDASLIANEIIDDWKANRSKGLVLKLELEKAFDKVDWDFLIVILKAKGSGEKWRQWIYPCMSTTNFAIIINGKPRGKFTASRGLRQGDPLLPSLFILVMDRLSRLLHHGSIERHLSGYSKDGSFHINHLQFAADDTLVFSSAEPIHIRNLATTIKIFEEASGFNINLQQIRDFGHKQ